MSSTRLALLVVTVLVGACSNDRGSDAPTGMPEAPLPGVYAGEFPCDGCAGITSTLWLRTDGRFFFSQHYAADNTGQPTAIYSLGRWSATAGDRVIELRGSGPKRVFMRAAQDTLLMQTDSDLEYRLNRDAKTVDFTDTIRMVGTMRVFDDGASFTECLTGLVAPVSKGGDYARFRHQYRIAAEPGEPTYVELEGRFTWSDDDAPTSLTIEHFITVKANGRC